MRILVAASLAWLATAAIASGQLTLGPLELRNHPNVSYMTAAVTDPVVRLQERIRRGEVRLTAEPTRGYLRSLLAALDVPAESQVLVFSKSSFQAARINPQNPRAIYFNDQVAVGWVRGGDVLELAVQDRAMGTVFYTLTQPGETGGEPRFARNNVNCVQCHTSDTTMNVPGWFIGSVYPEKNGMVAYGPAFTTDHRSPFDIRWGGWYVTGRHAGTRHLGNAVLDGSTDFGSMVTPASVHTQSLEGRFDPDGYLSPHSDIVALLVLEHQARMLNHITRVGWEARMGKDAGRPLDQSVSELVDYLLFVDEAPMPGPIEGPTAFARNFARQGPRDSSGRSLRDLQLNDRLMRYPCSYLIYSEPFDALPADAKALVYKRLWAVLSGEGQGTRYARLTPDVREEIIEILRATKKDLPSYYFSATYAG
jgi:hypothetical protein